MILLAGVRERRGTCRLIRLTRDARLSTVIPLVRAVLASRRQRRIQGRSLPVSMAALRPLHRPKQRHVASPSLLPLLRCCRPRCSSYRSRSKASDPPSSTDSSQPPTSLLPVARAYLLPIQRRTRSPNRRTMRGVVFSSFLVPFPFPSAFSFAVAVAAAASVVVCDVPFWARGTPRYVLVVSFG